MILDWSADAAFANAHAILDATTGAELPVDEEFGHVFYADDEAGVMRRYLTCLWSRSTKLPVVYAWPDSPSPVTLPFAVSADGTRQEIEDADVELAWEEVGMAIRIVPRREALTPV